MANYDLDFGGVKYQAKPLSSGSGYQLFSNNAPTTNYVMNDGSVMSGGKNIGSASLSGNNISFTDTSGQTATGTYGSTTIPTANQGQSYDSWIGNQGNAFQSPSDFYSWMAQGQNPSYVNQLINQNNIDPNSVIDAYNAGSGVPAISYDTGNSWLGNNSSGNNQSTTDNSAFVNLINELQTMIDSGQFDLSSLMNKYNSSVDDYSKNIDSYVKSAQDANNSGARKQMQVTAQDILNEMNAKGMLNSSVTGDTMSKGMAEIASNTGRSNMDAAMQGAALKGTIPSLINSGIATQSNVLEQSLSPYKTMLDILETYGPKYSQSL